MINRFLMWSMAMLLVVSCTIATAQQTTQQAKTDEAAAGSSSKPVPDKVSAASPKAKPVEIKIEDPLPKMTIRPWLLELKSSNHYYSNGVMSGQSSSLTLTCRVYLAESLHQLASVTDFKIETAITDSGEQLKPIAVMGYQPYSGINGVPGFLELSAMATLPMKPAKSLANLTGKLDLVWADSPVKAMTFSCKPKNFAKKTAFDDLPDEHFLVVNDDQRKYVGGLIISPGMMGRIKSIELKASDGKRVIRITPRRGKASRDMITVYRNVMEGGSIEFQYYPRIRRQVTKFTIQDMPLPMAIIQDHSDVVEVELTPVTP